MHAIYRWPLPFISEYRIRVNDKDIYFCDNYDDQGLMWGFYKASLAPLSFKYFDSLLYFLRQEETIKGKLKKSHLCEIFSQKYTYFWNPYNIKCDLVIDNEQNMSTHMNWILWVLILTVGIFYQPIFLSVNFSLQS